MTCSWEPMPSSPAGTVMPDGQDDASGASGGRAVEWATPEWAGEAAAMYCLLPDVADANATVSLSVVVASRREVSFYWCYEHGRPVGGGVGSPPGAQLALSAAARDADEIFSSAVLPAVAFMRGRLKATGEGGLLLAFLRSTSDPRFAAWCGRIAQLAEGDRSA
jgi:hypothetical protein